MEKDLSSAATVEIASPLPDAIFVAQEQLQRILGELRGEFERLSATGRTDARAPAGQALRPAVVRERHPAVQLLSRREKQVWIAITRGQSTKAIAYELSLSYKTVTGYRTTLMRKLKVHSVADLTRLGMQEEILSS
jgi:DNA-binding NarL/FixJ family response regulator